MSMHKHTGTQAHTHTLTEVALFAHVRGRALADKVSFQVTTGSPIFAGPGSTLINI